MAKLVAKVYHPTNGSAVEIWEGFSWPCLFFSFFWCFYKRMYKWAFLFVVINIILYAMESSAFNANIALTLNVIYLMGLLTFLFYANELHAKMLAEKGYLNQKQWNEKSEQRKNYQPVAKVRKEIAMKSAQSASSDKSQIFEMEDDGSFYEMAWNEIKGGKQDMRVWAKAYSISQGGIEKTKAAYIQLRVDLIKESFKKN